MAIFAEAEDIEADRLWWGSFDDTMLELEITLPDESRLEELLRTRARCGPSDVLTTA